MCRSYLEPRGAAQRPDDDPEGVKVGLHHLVGPGDRSPDLVKTSFRRHAPNRANGDTHARNARLAYVIASIEVDGHTDQFI